MANLRKALAATVPLTSLLFAAGLPLLALLVVRPWQPEPFPVWDYGEMLPILRESNGMWGALWALTEAYRVDGRANLLTYGQIALTWGLAGDVPLGWQIQRAIVMCVMGSGFGVVAWRLGVPPGLAGLGGLVLVLGVPATEGWLFLMGEPLGICLLLWMLLLCIGYSGTDRWKVNGLVIGILALCVLLTKEFMGFAILPVVGFAFVADGSGGLRWPRAERRSIWLLACLAAALLIKLMLLASALLSATPQGYAFAFGASGFTGPGVPALLRAMILPAWFSSSALGAFIYPSNLLAVIVLIGGGTLAFRSSWPRIPMLALLAFSPVLGAFAYSLWPRYSAFYGMPFWAASAGLLVACATSIHSRSRSASWAAHAALVLITSYCGLVADRTIREKHALAGVAEDIARTLPTWEHTDSLLIVMHASGVRRWPVTGGELERYAIAIGVPRASVPSGHDVTCEGAAERLSLGMARAALINDPRVCGPLPVRTDVHLRAYTYLDWISFGQLRDSVVVESLVPSLLAKRQNQGQ